MNHENRIESNTAVMMGKPVIKVTRIIEKRDRQKKGGNG